MNLASMRTLVRRDLKDEDASAYRWTNDEIDRAIDKAIRQYSFVVPQELKATVATTNNSRVVTHSLTSVICFYALEFPVDKYPRQYQRFTAYGTTTLELIGDRTGDGTNCYIYYGKAHDSAASTWTVLLIHEPVIALGAVAFAILQYGAFTGNRVNVGGLGTPQDILKWGEFKLQEFEKELRRLKSKVRKAVLYVPAIPLESQTTDWGP